MFQSSTSSISCSAIVAIPSDSGEAITSTKDVIVSIPSEHEGLSYIDLITSEVGPGINLFFEPIIGWDTLDNGARVEIAQSALKYAFSVAKEYIHDIATYDGYTTDGTRLFFNSSTGSIVLRNSDGSTYSTNIWPD
jgi:hypothetical protein